MYWHPTQGVFPRHTQCLIGWTPRSQQPWQGLIPYWKWMKQPVPITAALTLLVSAPSQLYDLFMWTILYKMILNSYKMSSFSKWCGKGDTFSIIIMVRFLAASYFHSLASGIFIDYCIQLLQKKGLLQFKLPNVNRRFSIMLSRKSLDPKTDRKIF